MIPQNLAPDATADEICTLAAKWKIETALAYRIHVLAGYLPFQVSIISGHRTAEEQKALELEGRPTAAAHLSTHLSCPATGADLRVSVAVTDVVRAEFGRAAVTAGLRWGGGSKIDPGTGIPSDWNHVDLGRRT